MNNLPIGAVVFDGVSKRYWLGTQGTLRGTLAALTRSNRNGDGPRDLWAVRDVSFRVEPGEALGLIGPNGAGKTTILKLLSDITRPTSGHIQVSGRLSSLIELGAGFHPELSGRENIFLNGAILGLRAREIRRRLDAIVAFAELERFIDMPVKRYSSGMYVRLGFAVAAHVEPDVLLVDEVLAVGDASFRQRCMLRMQALQQSGTTIMFVSHNLHMVRRMCKYALLLKAGEVRARGFTGDVIAEYEKSQVSVVAPSASREQLIDDRQDDGNLRLTNVTVCLAGDRTGLPEVSIESDDPVTVRIEYEADQPQMVGRIDVRVLREDGTLCSALDGRIDATGNDDGSNRMGRRGEIRLTLDPVQLTTGRYFVLVQITDCADAAVVASAQSETFAVFTQQAMATPGIFVPRSRWEHIRLA